MFDGETYNSAQDFGRLNSALGRVERFLRTGCWCTLKEVAAAAQCSESGASARIRDLRKEKFGGHNIESERLEGGLWRYRMVG